MNKRQLRKNKKKIRFIGICIVLTFFFLGITQVFFRKTPVLQTVNTNFSIKGDTQIQSPTPFVTPLPTISKPLENAVSNALIGTSGKYGIVVFNLKTNEYYSQNADTVFEAGSLYKLWVMATVFEELKQGSLKATTPLTKDVVALNKSFGITPDPLEQTQGTLSETVADALYNMITISSNNAALLLTDRVKIQPVMTFLQNYGFTQSKVGVTGKAPVTTPSDIAGFFYKLYHKQLINKDYSEKMIQLLTQQKLNEKLPKYLPDGVTIAHKTGELDNFTHDAGIIYTDFGDYIIVVLSESDDTDRAQERISLVSKAVYDYFANQQDTDITETPTPSADLSDQP